MQGFTRFDVFRQQMHEYRTMSHVVPYQKAESPAVEIKSPHSTPRVANIVVSGSSPPEVTGLEKKKAGSVASPWKKVMVPRANPVTLDYRLANKPLMNKLIAEDTSSFQHEGWVLKNNYRDHSIGYVGTIHEKTVDGFPFTWTKANVTFAGQKVAPFHAYMMDIEKRLMEPELRTFKVVERTDAGIMKLAYQRIKQPMFMTDRDNIIEFESTIEKAPDRIGVPAYAYYKMTVNHPEYPETKEAVRQLTFKKTLLWQDGADVRLIELANFNPRGNVPTVLNGLVMPEVTKGLARVRDTCCKNVVN